MKKLLFSALVAFGAIFQANSQACTVDTTVIPPGRFSFPDTLPCVEKTVAYDQVVQFKIPATINAQDFGSPIPFTLTIDSIVIDSVTGFPAGISAAYNPSNGVFYGGSAGCFKVSGTTNDPVGNYPVTVHGTLTARGTAFPGVFDGDTTISLAALSGFQQNPFGALSLDVINAGDPCRQSSVGINNVKSFNATVKAYPNPAINVLNVAINSVDRINGDMIVFDVMGRKVFTQKIDISGVQNFAIDVTPFASGLYNLVITDGYKKSATQFSVK